MPTLETIGGVLAFLVYAYLLHRQNKIMEQQNEIMREQGGAARVLANSRGSIKKFWPMIVMAAMLVLTWGAVGYDVYHHTASIPEFDEPQADPLVSSWGLEGQICDMTINGSALLPLRSDYKIAIGCFVFAGTEDILDAPNVQVSQLYDIRGDQILVRVPFSEAYQKYRDAHGAMGSHIALLLIPNGIEPSQFQTLRQARQLKVRILALRIGVMKHA
ncbi:MAG: hypothetical protein WB799_01575 [Candidatus Sulfotelmatobacter sp.]